MIFVTPSITTSVRPCAPEHAKSAGGVRQHRGDSAVARCLTPIAERCVVLKNGRATAPPVADASVFVPATPQTDAGGSSGNGSGELLTQLHEPSLFGPDVPESYRYVIISTGGCGLDEPIAIRVFQSAAGPRVVTNRLGARAVHYERNLTGPEWLRVVQSIDHAHFEHLGSEVPPPLAELISRGGSAFVMFEVARRGEYHLVKRRFTLEDALGYVTLAFTDLAKELFRN